MKFWPEKSFTIRTQLSPQEVVERLKNNTEKREINQIPRFNIPKYKPKGYIGLINNNNFTLYNNTTLYSQFFAERGSYILITGTIEAKDVGASITFKLQYDNGQKTGIWYFFNDSDNKNLWTIKHHYDKDSLIVAIWRPVKALEVDKFY